MTTPLPPTPPLLREDPSPVPESETSAATLAEERAVIRRVKTFSLIAYGACFLAYLIRWNVYGMAGLTCSTLVVMINFLWLEDSVVKALQPASSVRVWKLALPTVTRFTLFGIALSLTLYVVRVNTVSVLLGFSVIVAGIMAEGVYSIWKAIRSGR
jgi:hypothetical protein